MEIKNTATDLIDGRLDEATRGHAESQDSKDYREQRSSGIKVVALTLLRKELLEDPELSTELGARHFPTYQIIEMIENHVSAIVDAPADSLKTIPIRNGNVSVVVGADDLSTIDSVVSGLVTYLQNIRTLKAAIEPERISRDPPATDRILEKAIDEAGQRQSRLAYQVLKSRDIPGAPNADQLRQASLEMIAIGKLKDFLESMWGALDTITSEEMRGFIEGLRSHMAVIVSQNSNVTPDALLPHNTLAPGDEVGVLPIVLSMVNDIGARLIQSEQQRQQKLTGVVDETRGKLGE